MSILCSENGLSFSLLNKEKNKYVLIGHYKLSLDEPFEHLFEFLDRFDQIPDDVSLAFVDQRYTLIPKEIFNEADKDSYLKFLIKKPIGPADHIILGEQVLVFESLENRFSWLFERIPHIRLLNNAQVNLQSHFQQKAVNASFVSVQIFYETIEVCVQQKGKLTLLNTFNYSKQEDFLYFVLSVFDQLKLDPLETDLYLSGTLLKKGEEHQSLKQYIKNIHWDKKPEAYFYSYTFNAQEDHYNVSLFNQHLCV